MTTSIEISDAVVGEINDFLFYEAELLDTGRFEDWLSLLTEDIRYVIPVRVTRDRASNISEFLRNTLHYDESRDSLEMRVKRLATEYAWVENPPSRTRHFVTNVRVSCNTGSDGEYEVKSNLLLYRGRSDKTTYDLLSGERHDILRRRGDGFALAKRTVLLDHTTIPANLAVFL